MENNKDNIIKALEAEIIRLKTELIEVTHERDSIKKQFDELKIILRETWNNHLLFFLNEKTTNQIVTCGVCVGDNLNYIVTGDINQDGGISILYVILLVDIIMNYGNYDRYGDINGDGYLNIMDGLQLVNLILTNP